jgi:RimK family alpha-L-glutamate ligase
MAFAVVAHALTATNGELARAWRGSQSFGVLSPMEALRLLGPGDTVLARIDVRRALDGPESGLAELDELERRGVCVLNRAQSLLAGHDKLLTSHLLASAGVPSPKTRPFAGDWESLLDLLPCVVKPRFGSWGEDVFRVERPDQVLELAGLAETRSWLRTGGAVVQELVEPLGYDLRVLVAHGSVVGAVRRQAAPGEWRTNIACGGRRVRGLHSPAALALARTAVAVTGLELAGVDLLPLPDRGYTVLEINAAPDFTRDYSLGTDVFERVAEQLAAATDPRGALALGAA